MQFQDLPIEILLIILDSINRESLYKLSLLSRHLQQLTLPLFFSRCRIPAAKDMSTIEYLELKRQDGVAPDEVFRAIRVSVFIRSLKHLKCEFRFPESFLLHQIRHTYHLLEVIPQIEEFTVDFTLLPTSPLPSSFVSAPSPGLATMGEWHRAFTMLISMALGKGCSRINICGQPMIGYEYWFSPCVVEADNSPAASQGILQSAVRRFGWSSRSSAANVPPQFSLLANWIGLAKLHKVTKLGLEGIHFNETDPQVMLALLDIPSMTELSISSCLIPIPLIIYLLNRHPSIHKLHLHDIFAPSQARKAPKSRLPFRSSRLEYLHTHVTTLWELLLRWPTTFRHLQHIELTADVRAASNYDTIVDKLVPVAQAIEGKLYSLTLNVRDDDWLGKPQGETTNLPPRFRAFFSGLKRLEINRIGTGLGHLREHFPIWLVQFPELKVFAIVDHAPWTWCSVERRSLGEEIKENCKNVALVTINGEDVARGNDVRCDCPQCWRARLTLKGQ
ncbi:hypothetical protein HGRIS_013701 [Hohenbuehelia grisea]|uniref:F-box domain-containing protein n=1 Tax=Hohenbuehelia grisea TaxID=104357 RepID=A0ABR3IWI2_9AGAR